MRTMRNELVTRSGEAPLFGEAPEPFWASYRRDVERCLEPGQRATFVRTVWTVLRSEGLWALFAYRLGRFVHTRREIPGGGFVRRAALALMWTAYCALELWVSLLVDIQLHVTAQIAPGLYIGHFKSIHVGPDVRIGRDCNVGQMSWIAAAGPGFDDGAPVIGNRVYVGVGAKVIGNVRVGDEVAIGANAVVFDDVPDRAVMVGNPAKVVSTRGSGDFISTNVDQAPKKAGGAKRGELRA